MTKKGSQTSQKPLSLKQIEEILLYFSSSIFGQNTVEEILWDLAKNCIQRLGFVDCVIYLVDYESEKLVQKAAYGPKNPKDFELYKPIEIAMGDGIVGSVAESGLPEIINDTSKDTRYIVDDEVRFSEIAVPITHRGKVIGVLDSEHPRKNFFTQQHLMVLSTISSIGANKIVKAQMEEKYLEQHKELIVVEKKLAELKLASFRSQMNPHFIFNSLNAVQYFIVTNEKQLSMRYLSKFSKIIRYILENIHTETISLEEEFNMLNLYLELESIRFGDKFTYTIKLLSELNKSAIKIPFLLIQPFVEEAIEKRILGSGKRGHLTIEFLAVNDHLQCAIKDTGISRKQASELSSSKNLNLEPSGVDIARRRISDINKYNHHEIQIIARDRSGKTRENKGTEVLLSIPLNTE